MFCFVFFSETGSVTDLARLSGDQAPRVHLSAFPGLGLQIHGAIPDFYSDVGDPNIGPDTCTAGTKLMESPP